MAVRCCSWLLFSKQFGENCRIAVLTSVVAVSSVSGLPSNSSDLLVAEVSDGDDHDAGPHGAPYGNAHPAGP